MVRTVAPHLIGRRIVSAEFTSRHVTPGDRAKLSKRLKDAVVQSVSRRGKFILLKLDSGVFTVHLGMTGKLLVSQNDMKARTPHTYGIFVLDQGVLLYDDPRQFGKIEWGSVRADRLGPEPLEIGLEEFVKRLKKHKSRIKPLLLNQKFLAGVGNIYADESLFSAGIHPLANASRLSPARAAALHQSIREVLAFAIRQGGSSISDYVDAEGNRGYFQIHHKVYGREGEPCAACGTPIRKIIVGQRGTHYCPRCQRR